MDGRRTLYEVCTEGPFSAAENAKLMYAFHVLRMVGREDAEAADGAPDEAQPPDLAMPVQPAAGAADDGDGKSSPVKIRFKTAGDRFTDPPAIPEEHDADYEYRCGAAASRPRRCSVSTSRR